jgi:hypothetical protein
LAGFIQQAYHLDKGMIKLAKGSLLGEEESAKPHYSFALPRSLTSLRIPFFTLFILLLTGMILASQGRLSSFQYAKNFIWERVQGIYSQIPGPAPPSVSALPLEKERFQNLTKNELPENSERASQEVPE